MSLPLISIALATLLAGTVATFATGRYARYVALATSAAFLAEIGLMFVGFSWPGTAQGVPQFALSESYSWISLSWLQINYTVGLDGISLVLVLLTGFLMIATVIYSWNEQRRPAAWFGL